MLLPKREVPRWAQIANAIAEHQVPADSFRRAYAIAMKLRRAELEKEERHKQKIKKINHLR